jgi:hypothetical protein
VTAAILTLTIIGAAALKRIGLLLLPSLNRG